MNSDIGNVVKARMQSIKSQIGAFLAMNCTYVAFMNDSDQQVGPRWPISLDGGTFEVKEGISGATWIAFFDKNDKWHVRDRLVPFVGGVYNADPTKYVEELE